MRQRTAAALVALSVLTLLPAAAEAQVRASERASVSQTIDGTVITVDYARPRVRGRTGLFGEIVPWGRAWTGANDATTLELNKAVTIAGREVSAGRWSVWLVPAETGPWELVLDPRDTLFHTAHPGPTPDQIRAPVETESGEHVEALTWSFPRVASDGTTLTMAWDTIRVPLAILVQPSYVTTIPPGEAAAYVGSWTMRLEGSGSDANEPAPIQFDVHYRDDGQLRVQTIFPSPTGLQETELLMLPKAKGIFVPTLLRDGEIFDAVADLYIEFEFEGDRAVRFVMRLAADDGIFARGER